MTFVVWVNIECSTVRVRARLRGKLMIIYATFDEICEERIIGSFFYLLNIHLRALYRGWLVLNNFVESRLRSIKRLETVGMQKEQIPNKLRAHFE